MQDLGIFARFEMEREESTIRKKRKEKKERKKKAFTYVKAKKESLAKKEKRKKFHVEQFCGGKKLDKPNKFESGLSEKKYKKIA